MWTDVGYSQFWIIVKIARQLQAAQEIICPEYHRSEYFSDVATLHTLLRIKTQDKMLTRNKMQYSSNKMSNGVLQLKGKFLLSSPFPQVDGQVDGAINCRILSFFTHGEYMLTRHINWWSTILLEKDVMMKIEHIVRAGDSIHE
jgi:hypothetical protein